MKVRSIPRQHEAIQWKGYNYLEISKFVNGYASVSNTGILRVYHDGNWHEARVSDWVVRDARGEYMVYDSATFSLYFEEIK